MNGRVSSSPPSYIRGLTVHLGVGSPFQNKIVTTLRIQMSELDGARVRAARLPRDRKRSRRALHKLVRAVGIATHAPATAASSTLVRFLVFDPIPRNPVFIFVCCPPSPPHCGPRGFSSGGKCPNTRGSAGATRPERAKTGRVHDRRRPPKMFDGSEPTKSGDRLFLFRVLDKNSRDMVRFRRAPPSVTALSSFPLSTASRALSQTSLQPRRRIVAILSVAFSAGS